MKTIWLASYPKSGNTWLRFLLANTFAPDTKPVDINELTPHGGIASGRNPFDDLLLIDSGLLTHDEIDCLRPRVYEDQASRTEAEEDRPDRLSVRFVKAHDAYTLTPKGEPLLAGRGGARGAIVIVRDPRDVAPSFASHRNSTIDEAIAFMADANAGMCTSVHHQPNQFRQKLCGWSGHVTSWVGQSDIPVHLVRYEDMIADTPAMLRRVLDFAGLAATDEAIGRAVEFARFGRLRAQELERGFRESTRPFPGGNFFRRGEAGAWRDELTAAQVAQIEMDHAPMMRRLGYRLATHQALSDTG